MEFRSMFKSIFGNTSHMEQQTTTEFKMLNSYENYFAPAPKYAYDDLTVKAIINVIASHAAKFNINHIRRDRKGNSTIINDNLQKLFNCRVNEWMSTYDFLYKIITQLYINSNAFIKIKCNGKGEVIGLYPISYTNLELREYQNTLFVKFYFGQGNQETVPYQELIHLRRFFNNNDILGDSGEKSLGQQVGILNSLRQALENVVKNSGNIKGIIKINGVFRKQDKQKLLDEFDNALINKTTKHAVLDNSADYQQLNTNLQSAEEEQMSFVEDEIYKYFGINENIVKSQYNSDEWQSFYQNVLQPLAIQLSQEFTAKVFTAQEKAYGNEIVFSTDRLQYSSLQEKINLISNCNQTGILTVNEIRALLGFAPVDDGDVRQVSLNYVKENDQTLYQTGKDKNNNGIDDGLENKNKQINNINKEVNENGEKEN